MSLEKASRSEIIKATIVGVTLVALCFLAVFILHPDANAAPQTPTGELTVNGSTVTATYEGVKRSDRVRMSAQCQIQNTGVVWIEAQTLTTSPTTVTYQLPDGLSCRADLFVVSGGNKITYLDYEKLSYGSWE